MTLPLSTLSQSPPPKRKNDPAAMRGRVLDAAVSLFQQRGYAATSTHQIVAEAGISAGAMHHHFASKKAIGIGVIRPR
jgi:AcrR family transcriptional regulator